MKSQIEKGAYQIGFDISGNSTNEYRHSNNNQFINTTIGKFISKKTKVGFSFNYQNSNFIGFPDLNDSINEKTITSGIFIKNYFSINKGKWHLTNQVNLHYEKRNRTSNNAKNVWNNFQNSIGIGLAKTIIPNLFFEASFHYPLFRLDIRKGTSNRINKDFISAPYIKLGINVITDFSILKNPNNIVKEPLINKGAYFTSWNFQRPLNNFGINTNFKFGKFILNNITAGGSLHFSSKTKTQYNQIAYGGGLFFRVQKDNNKNLIVFGETEYELKKQTYSELSNQTILEESFIQNISIGGGLNYFFTKNIGIEFGWSYVMSYKNFLYIKLKPTDRNIIRFKSGVVYIFKNKNSI